MATRSDSGTPEFMLQTITEGNESCKRQHISNILHNSQGNVMWLVRAMCCVFIKSVFVQKWRDSPIVTGIYSAWILLKVLSDLNCLHREQEHIVMQRHQNGFVWTIRSPFFFLLCFIWNVSYDKHVLMLLCIDMKKKGKKKNIIHRTAVSFISSTWSLWKIVIILWWVETPGKQCIVRWWISFHFSGFSSPLWAALVVSKRRFAWHCTGCKGK